MNNSLISNQVYVAKLKLYSFLLFLIFLLLWYLWGSSVLNNFKGDLESINRLDKNIVKIENKIKSFEYKLKAKGDLTGDVRNIFDTLFVFDKKGDEYKYILKTFFNELLVGINKPILVDITFDEGWKQIDATIISKRFTVQLEVKNINQLLDFLEILDKDYYKLSYPLVVNVDSLNYDILKYNEPQVVKIRGNIYFLKQ